MVVLHQSRCWVHLLPPSRSTMKEKMQIQRRFIMANEYVNGFAFVTIRTIAPNIYAVWSEVVRSMVI